MLKVLVLAAQNNVADARMEYLIRDRLSWLRFLGFDLGAATPDANTIRLFREKLTEAGALYQPAVILTHEDGFWRFSARSARNVDVVHRHEGATLSGGRQKPPCGLPFPSAGLRRSLATMNHIAASAAPRQQTGMAILMGQDHRRLVLDLVFADFDRQLKERGYLAMGGQIVDATLVAAPKQRNTVPEKDAIKAGRQAREIWPDKPARAAQKDTDARWTLKFVKAKPLADGRPGIDIAIPSFGYKSSISICRTFGFIRKCKVTDGARFDGRMLRDVVTGDNTASDVWADTAYRGQANEAWLKRQSRVSRIHRRKPRGKAMPERTARANAAKSKVRACVEHVFARQKDQMGLFIRTIGIKRAEAKITLANLAYNMHRLIFHERRAATG